MYVDKDLLLCRDSYVLKNKSWYLMLIDVHTIHIQYGKKSYMHDLRFAAVERN